MKVTLSIPDDTYALYEISAKLAKKTLEGFIVSRLQDFQELGPNDRYLFIRGEARQQLEKLLGGLPITTPQDLLQKVSKFSTFALGECEITLSEGELKELHRMAKRNNRTPQAEMEIRTKLVRQLMFNSAGFQRVE